MTYKKKVRASVLLILLTCSCMFSLTQYGYAQCITAETFKLLASDGTEQDYFGLSVAISGNTAIVGAYGDDDNGDNSGSVYLFDTTTGQQLFKLLSSDGGAGDDFGNSVAISGTTAIVGVTGDDDNGPSSGSAYLFDTTTGQQLFKLLPTDGTWGDYFGGTVAISGITAIVGAFQDEDNGAWSGSAYLFDTTTGQQLFKLLPSDGAAGDFFSTSVAISGTTAIVGSPDDDDNGDSSGSVYLFDTTTGQQLFKLLPNDGAAGDAFGYSVAINGTTVLIGAPHNNDNGRDSGSAYLFDTTTGQQLFKLLPSDGARWDGFGYSVAISGTTAIVGADGDRDNGRDSGSAYFFDTSTGQQIFKLLPSDGAANDEFGWSVAISGTTAIVGAFRDDDNGLDSGSAYLFDNSSDTILIIKPLLAGQYATFSTYNMKPNTETYLAYTLHGTGKTYIPDLNITLDLETPTIYKRMKKTDATGYATANLFIPQQATGKNVWFQACQYELKTNVVATSIK